MARVLDPARDAPPLHIHTLGTFRLTLGGEPLALPKRAHNRPLALLKALVALGAEGVPAEVLCDHLWPDADGDRAAAAFDTTLFRLRRRIPCDAFRLESGLLSLDSQAVWLDLWALHRSLRAAHEAVRAGAPEAVAAALEEALGLYRGPLLAGDEEPPPVPAAREALQALLGHHIEAGADCLEGHGHRAQALTLCLRGLDAHPAADGLCRRVLRTCLAMGEFAVGIAAYRRCESALRAQYRVEPAQETTALFAKLQASTPPPDLASHVEAIGAPRWSLAVLPFRGLGEGPALQPVSEGLAADVMTELARTTLLGVVSHHIASVRDPSPQALRTYSRELGIAYALHGTVQQAGARLRVNVRLLQTATGREIWGERFEGAVDEAFQLQAEIAQCVVEEVDRLLFNGEHFIPCRFSSDHPEAHRLFLAAQKDFWRRPDRIGAALALRTSERALAIDPTMACAQVVVANATMTALENGWSLDSRRELDRAREALEHALAHGAELGMVHAARARLLMLQGAHERALDAAAHGVACEAGRADVQLLQARTQLLAGLPALALASAERAARTEPRTPAPFMLWLGAAYLMAGRPAEALRWLSYLARRMPASPGVGLWLAAAHAAVGDRSRARRTVRTIGERHPDFDPHFWVHEGLRFRREPDRERLLGWLHIAGVPVAARYPLRTAAARADTG